MTRKSDYPSKEEMRQVTVEQPMPSSENTRLRIGEIAFGLKAIGEARLEVGDDRAAFPITAGYQFIQMILENDEAWDAAYKAVSLRREFDRVTMSGQGGSA